jgi:hypothetical protein
MNIKLLSGGSGGARRGFAGASSSSLVPDNMTFRCAYQLPFNWKKCAMSRDGHYMVVGAKGNGLYNSVDYGFTFNLIGGFTGNWMSICCSADGRYFYAEASTGTIWRSTDYGVTWNLIYNDGSTNMYDLDCSSDGSILLMAKGQTGLQNKVSLDYGINWSDTFPNTYVMKCAVTGNGQTMFLCRHSGVIYKNNNYGNPANWDAGTNIDVGAIICDSISCSADGQYLMVSFSSRWLYLSNDGGATWTKQGLSVPTGTLDDPGSCTQMSRNGKIQCYNSGSLSNDGELVVSSDYGVTWKMLHPRIGLYGIDFSDDFKYVLRPSHTATLGPTANLIWVMH